MPHRLRNVLLVVLAFGLVGCAAWALSLGTLPPADFTFNNSTEIKSVDPATVTGVPEGRIIWAIFEGLCVPDPKTLEPRPGVAERWEISPDGRTYTFHLREDAVWSDGMPVTAQDFVWSLRRFLHPDTAAEYAYEMWYVEGAEAYTKSQVAVGDEVEIELLTRPAGALPFAAGTIIKGKLRAIEPDPRATEKKPEDAVNTYIIKIEGKLRRFRHGGGNDAENYKWLLPDFNGVAIRALDERTLEMKLKSPTPYFLNLLAFYPTSPVNRKCLETHGAPDWTKPENIVSNGPFKLHTRRLRDRMRLVKSESYWDRAKVKLNSIDALCVESETTGLNLYLTGAVDYVDSVPAAVVPDLLHPPRPDFKPAPYMGTYYYRLNLTQKPLDDVRVRRALSLALNREPIVKYVTRAGQIPAHSFTPPGIKVRSLDEKNEYAYDPPRCGEYNLTEARRLLAEAGFPGGKGFPKLEILYNNHEAHEAIAQVVQSQWKENLGIDIRLAKQDWGADQGTMRPLQHDIARAAWIGDYPDPNTFLKMMVTGGANNQTGWGNAEYDDLIAKAAAEPDQQQRLEYFQRAERILMDEMPLIPVYYYVSLNMAAPYVKGLYPNIQNVQPLKEVSIDAAEKARFRPQDPNTWYEEGIHHGGTEDTERDEDRETTKDTKATK